MTTARERYEAKTRVVTFRVHQELYGELEKIRQEAELSYADLIKLGAGIAQGEIQRKLGELGKAQNQLAELRQTIQQERRAFDAFIEITKKKQLAELEQLHQIYSLFDAGWSTDEVRFKLRISQSKVYHYFKEWGELRGEREKLQTELLKKCLQNRIATLRGHIYWRATGRELEEAEAQLEYCCRMPVDPSRLSEEEKAMLIADHSYFI